jgi:hypothetical protein
MADFFGAGVLFASPQSDADGNVITTISPVQFGIVQGVTIDDEQEIKELYGSYKYPVDIGGGKSKLTVKCKQALINAELFNAVYYGQTLTSAYDAIYADTVGTAVPTGAGATSIHISPTAPFGGTSVYVADLGVQDGNGTPYTRVASSPTSGQYTLSGQTYTFNDIDSGKTVFINYQYSNATNPSTGKLLTVYNKPMGIQPVFSAQFFVKRFLNGATRTFWRKFPNCVATKLSMDFKNDDFVVPDFEISAFADSNNIVQQMSWTE